jgi:hypothetical protein
MRRGSVLVCRVGLAPCLNLSSLPFAGAFGTIDALMKTPASTSLSLVLSSLIVLCFALLPEARATCQQGCLSASNTALGDDALVSDFLGGYNTAVGFNALLTNTDGNYNTAIGYQALYSNSTGISNTATGANTLHNNTTGSGNVAVVLGALYYNVTGSGNTATGTAALTANTGDNNTATGGGALYGNNTGNGNTASGHLALEVNSVGSENTATGDNALSYNFSGNNNTAEGANALLKTTGDNNIGLGSGAGSNLTAGDNNIDIGNAGVRAESSTVRIGTEGTHTATYIAGIRQSPLATGTAVGVGITADGRLGVRVSSARFKEAIKSMDKRSEDILNLKPVTFRYKKELDAKGTPQFGLVAEEVAKVNPDLVVTDDQGKPFTVRYDEVNVMLLNEFLKEHKKVEEQASKIEELESALEKITARLDDKGL